MVLGTLLLPPNIRRTLCITIASIDIFFIIIDCTFFLISLNLHSFNEEFSVLFEEDSVMAQTMFVSGLFLSTLFSLCVHLFSSICLFSVSDWRIIFLRQSMCLNSLFLMVVLKAVNLIMSTSAATITANTQSHLRELLEEGMKKRMEDYESHLNYKVLIDRLQATYSCCGARGFKDWFSQRWFRSDYLTLPLNKSMSEKYISKGFFEGSSVPFSCCSVKAMRSCVNIFVVEDGHFVNYDPKHDKTIYLEGCGGRISFAHASHVASVCTLIICLNVVQFFNLMVCRLIQTAVQTASDHGDPTQTSYGYFFSFGIPLRPPGSRVAHEALQRRKALMKRLAQRDDVESALTDVKMAQLDEYYVNEGGQYNTTNNKNTTSNNSSDTETITTSTSEYRSERETERKKHSKKKDVYELQKFICEKNIGRNIKHHKNKTPMKSSDEFSS